MQTWRVIKSETQCDRVMLSISKTILKFQHEENPRKKRVSKLGVINGQRGEFHLPLHISSKWGSGWCGLSNNHWKYLFFCSFLLFLTFSLWGKRKNKVEALQNKRFNGKMKCLPLWSNYIGEKGRTLGKIYGIRVRCYWEHPWGTHWEPDRNPLGT